MIVITVARKPLKGSVADNVVQWGTGGLNLDKSRIKYENTPNVASNPLFRTQQGYSFRHGVDKGASFQIQKAAGDIIINPAGRYPSNVIFEHKPQCLSLGVGQVKGIRVDTRPEGDGGRTSKDQWRFRPTDATRRGYSDENGMETVEEWECVEGCPVDYVNKNVGIMKSGRMDSIAKGGDRTVYSRQGSRKAVNPASEGYVSRFFLQIQAEPNCNRASGECVCEDCGQIFYKHPVDGRFPFLNVLCNGDKVKL